LSFRSPSPISTSQERLQRDLGGHKTREMTEFDSDNSLNDPHPLRVNFRFSPEITFAMYDSVLIY
jgi:hypothetical protein